ncbi:CAP domain-containing protein [Syncephalis fuscata]|nr:CAP domain-containing protein [Syncephalis fuscata]
MKTYILIATFALLATNSHKAESLALFKARLDPIRMLCDVNEYRAKNGRKPLGLDADLSRSATRHSQIQAQQNKMSHHLPGEPDLGGRIKALKGSWLASAENVHQVKGTQQKAMEDWIKSDGHRRNLLSDAYTHAGFGMVVSKQGTPYWTQVFSNDPKKKQIIPKCK